MEANKCCIPDCCGSDKLLEFPHPVTHLDKFKRWISFIGVNPSYYCNDYTKIYQVFKKKRLCNLHFVPIVYKNVVGERVIIYGAPEHYGPEFWKQNKKRLMEKVNNDKNRKKTNGEGVQTRKRNIQQNTTNILLNSEIKRLLPITAVNHTSAASPRILRKRKPIAPKNVQEENPLADIDTAEMDLDSGKEDSKKPRLSNDDETDTDEAITDSDQDYEAEYLDSETEDLDSETENIDSDTEKTDTAEKVLHEIEYLDMNNLDIDDNQQITTMNTGNVTETLKTYTRKPTPQHENQKCTPILEIDSKSGCISIKVSRNDSATEDLEKSTVVNEPTQKVNLSAKLSQANSLFALLRETPSSSSGPLLAETEDTPQSPNEIIQPALRYEPILEIGDNGSAHITLCKIDPVTENVIKTTIENQPIRKVNQSPALSQAKTPLCIKKLDSKSLQEFMAKHNLKPIDTKTPLHQQLSATMAILQNDQKLPIASPHLQDQLAAVKSHNQMNGNLNKKTNVFVLDSKGSVIIKEQLGTEGEGTPLGPKPVATAAASPHLQDQVAAITSQNPTTSNVIKKKNVLVLDSEGSVAIREDLVTEDTPPDQTPAATETDDKQPNATPNATNALKTRKTYSRNPNEILPPLVQPRLPPISPERSGYSNDGINKTSVDRTLKNATSATATQQSRKTIAPQKSGFYNSVGINKMFIENRTLKNELKAAKTVINKLKSSTYRLKSRLTQERSLQTNTKFLKAANKMARIPRIITAIQLRDSGKGRHGRRFTEEEKDLAYSLREQCPSTYKFMLQMGFIMPTDRTLCKPNFKGAIDSAVDRNGAISKLKAKIDNMPAEFRLCTLLFDEKLISPPNRKNHVLTVLGNEGEETEVTFPADHALIFMVKGILSYYQEPVSYTYSFGPTNGTELASQLKSVIADLQSIGYKVLATICDQAENNRLAIDILINETICESLGTDNLHNNVFKVNNEEIISLYDPPHLLKGIRNNLISKNLIYQMDGRTKTAQWQHLEMLFSENPEYNGEKLIAKLTESHVYPNKLGIGKIKFASQVFSNTIAKYMGYLADKDILPSQSRDTADLFLFFDELFDSVNGHPSTVHKQKPLLSAVKPNSLHHKKWTEAITVLRSMTFANNGNVIPVSDIHCWIWTLDSYSLLLQRLFRDHQSQAVWMRHLNLDDLEMLFRKEVDPPIKSTTKSKKVSKLHRFPFEIVTQKVIKAINRINRQDK